MHCLFKCYYCPCLTALCLSTTFSKSSRRWISSFNTAKRSVASGVLDPATAPLYNENARFCYIVSFKYCNELQIELVKRFIRLTYFHWIQFLFFFSIRPIPSNTLVISYILRFCFTFNASAATFKSSIPCSASCSKETNLKFHIIYYNFSL